MSFDSLLINTATVRRYTEGAADAYGRPAKTWADHLTDEPCRLVASSGREVEVGAEVVIADNMVFFGDIDITEQDRIVIDSVTYEAILVLFRQDATNDHHKQVYVRVVR